MGNLVARPHTKQSEAGSRTGTDYVVYSYWSIDEARPKRATKTAPNAQVGYRFALNSVTSAVQPDQAMAKLQQSFTIRGDARVVAAFLRGRQWLTPLLELARDNIARVFGRSTETALDVFTYPGPTHQQELFLVIRTRLTPREARRKMRELDDAWWLDAMPGTRGEMTIGLEYIPYGGY